MRLRVKSKKALISSQGTPQRTDRVRTSSNVRDHGWFNKFVASRWLEIRSKRHITGNSSIRFFLVALSLAQLNSARATETAQQIPLNLKPQATPVAPAEGGIALEPKPGTRPMMLHGMPLKKKAPDKIDEVADQFESLMLHHMYQQMRNSSQIINSGDDNPFAPSHAEMIYRSMLDDEVMNRVSKSRPIGAGDLVARQLRGELGINGRPPPAPTKLRTLRQNYGMTSKEPVHKVDGAEPAPLVR